MTSTSDERRKVAKGLRKLAAPGCIRYAEEFHEELREIVAFDRDGSFEGVANSLADLIDPTCHLVGTISVDSLGGQTIFSHELSCGHTFNTVWPNPPAFCDECGARVVEKEEDE